jgi:SAM-dependent methyltransferase
VSSTPGSPDFYDVELRAHHEHLRAAYGISPGDEVLDIGCGTGLTTREAARAAAPGRVVGVDVSERMLERARQVTASERLGNVQYELPTPRCIASTPSASTSRSAASGRCSSPIRPRRSRTSPPAATRRAPGAARLAATRRQRLGAGDRRRVGRRRAAAQPGADPFSLGDAEATARILDGAGFDGMRFEGVHEPVLYGHDLDAALAFVLGFQETSAALASLSDAEAARTVERLRETLAAHYSNERGVVLGSRSWLITARRRRYES